MATKQSPSAIISGMGVGMSLIQSIVGKAKKKGLSDEDIHRLATPEGEELLDQFVALMAEQKRVELMAEEKRAVADVIDCNADPLLPEGWTVEEHRRMGQMEWDPTKVSLYLSDRQRGSGMIKGNDLREEFAGKPVLNANVLDWLLKRPEEIPEEWKGKDVFFWGTIYHGRDGLLHVRYLCWRGVGWYWNYDCLSDGWHSKHPAVLASI